MKFSEAWLREWVNPDLGTEELAEQMTLMGLEIDDIESAQPAFKGVVVAEVVSAEKHPDADSLRICSVNYGAEETAEIVCGAPNAAAGLKAPLAVIGARLPGGVKIRKTKLRGIVSQGMLCSASELELAAEADGLLALPADAPVGTPLEQYLGLQDSIMEVELTPNRGDCLSIRGLARDVCARNNLDIRANPVQTVTPTIEDTFGFSVSPGNACVRFTGRVIKGINGQAKSPLWLTERLRRSGVRSINPAVDVTNYVMLELGQPMHAFDLDKLTGDIQVRLAKEGEQVRLLDDREVTPGTDVTVIADDSGAISVAGIMGGLSTSVDTDTRNIYFEAALFTPEGVAGKAWRLDAHSDSSHRFERGVDPAGQLEAQEYAARLLMDICGGEAGPVSEWSNKEALPIGGPMLLREARITRLLGKQLSGDEIESVLTRLGVNLQSHEDGWTVTPPTHRYDLRIEEDYVEELARVHGYDNIPRTSSNYRPQFSAVSETSVGLDSLKNLLVARGYQEVVTFSFVDDERQKLLTPAEEPIALSNPIASDLGVMRSSLATGLLNTLRHNLNRQVNDLRIFESGLRYIRQGNDIKQEMMLAGLINGSRYGENWSHSDEAVDFFDIKGDLESLFQMANGHTLELHAGSQKFLHPGQSADVVSDGEIIGWIGRLHPGLQKSLDVSQIPLMFEVSIAGLSRVTVPKHREVSRFPGVRRDIAIVVPEAVSSEQVTQCIQAHGPEYLQKIVTFDIYSGDRIDLGMKSMALGLILQEFSRTLAEKEIDEAIERILDGLKKDAGAILRV